MHRKIIITLVGVLFGIFFIGQGASATLDFSVSVTPNQGIVDQGQWISFVITASNLTVSDEDVEFSINGMPTPSQAIFSSSFCTPTCNTLVTLYTEGTTPDGKYTLTIEGRGVISQSIVKTASYALIVSDPDQGALSTRSWLQTDSSALETGFNLPGNTKTQTGVRGTGDGAGVGLSFDSTWGTNWQSVTINDFYADSIAIDSVGNKIYTTGGNSYVRRFDSGGGSTTFGNSSQNFGSPGSGINQFSGPYDISIDTINNKVYVADSGNDRIARFDSGGGSTTFGANWQTFGSPGSGTDQFNNPASIIVDTANNKIYVGDSINDTIARFDSGDGSTTFGANWQTFGTSAQFNGPVGINIDTINNKVYVADNNFNRIARFDSGGGSTTFGANWQTFGSPGSGIGQFSTPLGIIVDTTSDKIYVADYWNYRVARFDSGGGSTTFGANWQTFGSNGSGVNQFQSARDIAIDAINNKVYVADRNVNRRVVMFDSGIYYVPSGTFSSAIYDTAQNSTFTNLTFSSTVPTNYNEWAQTTDGDFGGTNASTTVSLESVKLGPPTGALSSKTDYPTGSVPWGVAISSDGASVYVTNSSSNTVSMFSRDTTTGALSAKTDYATGTGPQGIAISSDGASVYVTNYAFNTVSMFSRNTTTGALSSKTDYATGSFPWGVAISSDGASVYVTNTNSNTVSMFSRNASYFAPGTYTSPVKQLPPGATVGTMNWTQTIPAGTSIAMSYRLCSSSCATEAWISISNGTNINQSANYIQYRATLTTSDTTVTPSLDSVSIGVSYTPMTIKARSCDDALCSGETWTTIDTDTTAGTETRSGLSLASLPSPANRYIQYQVDLATVSNAESPMLDEIGIEMETPSDFNFSLSMSTREGSIVSGSAPLVFSGTQGAAASLTFGTAPTNPVVFRVDPAYLPSGVTVTFATSTTSCGANGELDCTADVTFNAPTAGEGTYAIPISASVLDNAGEGTITKEVVFTLTVTEPFSYSINWANAAPCSGGATCSTTVAQGSNIPLNFDITKLTGVVSETVAFTVASVLPQGVSVSFSYNSCAPTCPAVTATVYTTLNGTNDTPVTTGSPYVITIRGTSSPGNLIEEITLNLSVTAGFNFSFTFDNIEATNGDTSLSAQTRAPNTSVSPVPLLTTRFISGSADRVSYSISNPDPTYIIITPSTMGDCDFTGTTAPPTQTCQNGLFDIAVLSGIAEGTYTVRFTATAQSSGNRKDIFYSLTVYPPFDFTLAWQDTGDALDYPITMYQGDSLMKNVIVTYNSPIPETINLTASVTSPESGIIATVSPQCAGTCVVTLFVSAGSAAVNDFTASVNLTANAPAQSVTHSVKIAPLSIKIPPFNYNMMGWAWSDGVGWISFNTQNCDTNWNGQMDADDFTDGTVNGKPHAIASAQCPADGTLMPNYGAHLDLSTYELSGYAWSEHVGWISFERSITGNPPADPFQTGNATSAIAKLDIDSGIFEGWGRAVSCPDTECDADSEWGWIKLSGIALDLNASPYSVDKTSANEFSGFAWGDKVLSWISFNSKNCDDNGLLAAACGGDGMISFAAHDNLIHPDEYMVWVKGQLPNSPPTCENLTVSYPDICGAPFSTKLSCTYQDKDNNGVGDPLVQYAIEMYDGKCDVDQNKFIDAVADCIDSAGVTRDGDNATTPNNPIDTAFYPAIPDTNTPGKYIPYPNAQNPIISGSTIEYTYDGNATLNYAGRYYFVITVQDEYHLE